MEPAPAKASTPVRVRSLARSQRWTADAIYGFIRLLSTTLGFQWRDESGYIARHLDRPVIFAFWHNRLLLVAETRRRYHQQIGRGAPMAAMMSASRDGALSARVLSHFGIEPVRGSSSRRGPQALLEMTTWAERGYDLAIAPDGPRGPCYVVQPGVVYLAQLTGLPIIPASYYLSRKLRSKSWDRMQIPLPLSRCVVTLGQPLFVPRDASEEAREVVCRGLETTLRRITRD